MNVEITQMPAMRVAAVRHTGPYDRIQPAFQSLGSIAGSAGLFGLPGALMLGIYFDDPRTVAPEALRSAAAVVIGDDTAIPAGLTEIRLPAGRFASVTHLGPYEGLGDTWNHLMGQWLPASGQTKADDRPAYEVYRNNPSTAAPHELRTDLYIPLV